MAIVTGTRARLITFEPTGPITARNVQDAVVEAAGGGGGGGAQSVRLLGPYTVTQADIPNDQDFFALPYTPAHGDVILNVMCRVVTAFDAGGGPVTILPVDGSTGGGYGIAWDVTVASADSPVASANGAEPMDSLVGDAPLTGVGAFSYMGGTPPAAPGVVVTYSDVPVAVGEIEVFILVATPPLA